VGGGTTTIGDPTDRTAARPIMSREQIDANARVFKRQLTRFLDFSENAEHPEGRAIMVDNADWLLKLNYLEFLRDYGRYFSVNEMLRMETYRSRLETGLSFLEFNYALLQGYDFLELYRRHGCTLQCGGSDQWSNVLAGADLIRRCERVTAYALTWPLLADESGEKMGKSSRAGQVWLDPGKTSPHDFFQHWISVPDDMIGRMLATYTFMPMDEIRELTSAAGAELRGVKERLAFEVTSIVHGEDQALKARAGARRLFGGASLEDIAAADDVPTVALDRSRFASGIGAADLIVEAGLADSRGAARRLIDQGGAYLNKERLGVRSVTEQDLVEGALVLQAGRKRFVRVVAK
ncbi:MAG: tyrosine--tRNA ligase, partial [Chloroflexota bacterium]